MNDPTGELPPFKADKIEIRDLPNGGIGIASFKKGTKKPFDHLQTVEVTKEEWARFTAEVLMRRIR